MELVVHDVPTGLGRVRVHVGGAPDGPAMLFWPSLLMDHSMWTGQAEHFAPRYRVVLIDPPGHGGSEPLTAPFTLDACAHVVTEIQDVLEVGRSHFVGNSWGAMTGLVLAAAHPQRVDRVVLMNGTASRAGRVQRARYAVLVAAVRAVGFAGPLRGAAVRAFLGPTSLRTRPDVVAAVRASISGVDVTSVSHAVTSVVPRRPDQAHLLSTITAPVLVIAGREDATFPVTETELVADGIPGATFVVVEDAAHLAALEVPDAVNTLIAGFLVS